MAIIRRINSPFSDLSVYLHTATKEKLPGKTGYAAQNVSRILYIWNSGTRQKHWERSWESERFVAKVTEIFASGEPFFSPAKMSPPVNVCEHHHGLTGGYLPPRSSYRRKALAKKGNNNFLFIIVFYHGSHDSHGSHGSHRGSHGSLARTLVRPGYSSLIFDSLRRR